MPGINDRVKVVLRYRRRDEEHCACVGRKPIVAHFSGNQAVRRVPAVGQGLWCFFEHDAAVRHVDNHVSLRRCNSGTPQMRKHFQQRA